MRVNLITQASASAMSGKGAIQLSLTIRPSCGLPGDYQYLTNSSELLRLLRLKTDLPDAVLHRFETHMYSSNNARLLGVELSDRVLTEIGYFVD